MLIKKWDKLPEQLQIEEIRPYYDVLRKKNFSLFCKRVFDVVCSLLLLLILSPIFIVLSILIKLDSKGPIFYRQKRITQYGKVFYIHKFRTMYIGSDKKSQVTVSDDDRITKVGKLVRGLRLDEVSQLIDVLVGNMTFVGTRPEVPKYVECYTNQMKATLLLPAGITSEASINFKDEADLLENADDVDKVYVEDILPKKMEWNLLSIKRYGFWREIGVMFKTVFAVLGLVTEKEFDEDRQ